MRLNFKTLKIGHLIMAFIIIMAALVQSSSTVNAQSLFERGTIMGSATTEQTNPQGIKDFTVRSDEHSVYIEFSVSGETEKSTFYLERSENGTDYIVIAQKKVCIAPDPAKAVSYNFIDQKPLKGKSYYKVMQIKDNGVAYSEAIPFENNFTQTPLFTENKDEK